MILDRVKIIAIFSFVFLLAAFAVFNTNTVIKSAAAADVTATFADTAATYKAQCAMCHGQKAEKLFDVSKTDEEHVEIILKGKKGEKPPYMPAYESKGMKPEEAKALAEYMRALRTPAN